MTFGRERRIFDIIRGQMNSLSLQIALLEQVVYAGVGMGIGSFCVKEIA